MPLVAFVLSAIIFPHFSIWSIHFRFALFPRLTDPHIVADKVQLFAVATVASALVVTGHRDALNPYLGHKAVVVILAV